MKSRARRSSRSAWAIAGDTDGVDGQEEIAGTASLRYRMNDPAGQGARLIQSLLALTGEIRSLKLEVWIAVPGGYVATYNFQVELSGARVLDADGKEVRADQAVTWTYQLSPSEESVLLAWPAGARSRRGRSGAGERRPKRKLIIFAPAAYCLRRMRVAQLEAQDWMQQGLQCVHRWLLGAVSADGVPGRCRRCGEERLFEHGW